MTILIEDAVLFTEDFLVKFPSGVLCVLINKMCIFYNIKNKLNE